MTKSSIVQKLLKYFVNPSAIHLRNISMIKIKQNPKLVQYNIRFSGLFASRWMSSKHNVILDAKISTSTNHSNAGVSTTARTDLRRERQQLPSRVFMRRARHGQRS